MLIATDPFSLLFIGSFLFGLLFLIMSALLGSLSHGHSGHGLQHASHSGGNTHLHAHSLHLHPSHHGGTSVLRPGSPTDSRAGQGAQGHYPTLAWYLNPTFIVLFLLGFGFFGYVFHTTTTLALPVALILAAGGGILIAVLLLTLIERLFGDSEGATIQDVSDRTGLLGKVSVTIQQDGLGEIIYTSPGGMRKSVPARSVDGRRLERNQEVIVVSYTHGVAEVDTWDHVFDEEETHVPSAAKASEFTALQASFESFHQADTAQALPRHLSQDITQDSSKES